MGEDNGIKEHVCSKTELRSSRSQGVHSTRDLKTLDKDADLVSSAAFHGIRFCTVTIWTKPCQFEPRLAGGGADGFSRTKCHIIQPCILAQCVF